MPTIAIEEKGCRACSLCAEVCPTQVFDMDAGKDIALVARQEDCIGCTSCEYICPSRCLSVTDYEAQRPFHRIEENRELLSKFLQQAPAESVLTVKDYEDAMKDVSVRLHALTEAFSITLGRGQKAAGRAAGQLSASHMPEMYEGKSIEEILSLLRKRFQHCFDFDATVSEGGDRISLAFAHCAIRRVVEGQGEKIGAAALCNLFHEYWAGLIGSFHNKNLTLQMSEVGDHCRMELNVQRK